MQANHARITASSLFAFVKASSLLLKLARFCQWKPIQATLCMTLHPALILLLFSVQCPEFSKQTIRIFSLQLGCSSDWKSARSNIPHHSSPILDQAAATVLVVNTLFHSSSQSTDLYSNVVQCMCGMYLKL